MTGASLRAIALNIFIGPIHLNRPDVFFWLVLLRCLDPEIQHGSEFSPISQVVGQSLDQRPEMLLVILPTPV